MERTTGAGDKRTRRGKIFRGSYGKTRPHRVKKSAAPKGKPAR
jgi:30S ribosomal protein S31